MSRPRASTVPGDGGERGFALLVLFGLVGMGSLGLLLAVQAFVTPLAEIAVRIQHSVATIEDASRSAFRLSGAFPSNLDALATAVGLDASGTWRMDPWNPPVDLDYQLVAGGLRIRSTGRDRQLGTGDDIVVDVLGEDLVRLRQRARLRLIRAVLLRSQFCKAMTMTPTDLTTMQTAMRDHAAARRAWLTADAAARVTLQATLTSTAATVTALRSAHSCPPIPLALTGFGGLMSQLGFLDTLCVDGQGLPLIRDPILGVLATGFDAVGGTDDDM